MANLRGGGFVGFDALSSVPPPPSTVAYMQNAWNILQMNIRIIWRM